MATDSLIGITVPCCLLVIIIIVLVLWLVYHKKLKLHKSRGEPHVCKSSANNDNHIDVIVFKLGKTID